MKIFFRSWLEEHQLDPDSTSLFEESFRCFGAGAYRATLLFSYLGLLRALAFRILTATRPKDYPATKWDSLQEKVRSEGEWEAATAQCLQEKKPLSVFLIDDDLRRQLLYWRDRRNDAAHWRGTEVTHAHVEALWSFIQSHLPKMAVSGGFDALLLRFTRHYDPNYTRPGRDASSLVRDLPLAVRPDDYRHFISSVVPILREADKQFAGDALDDFVSSVLEMKNDQLAVALKEALLEDVELLLGLLLDHTRLVLLYGNDAAFIRRLWRELLPFRVSSSTDSWEVAQALGVLLAMLQQNLIPVDERAEALDHVVSNLDEGERGVDVPEGLFDALQNYGFFEAIERHAVDRINFDWLGDNVTFTCAYLSRCRVTSKLAYVMTGLYSERRLGPEQFSSLGWFFSQHPGKHRELLEAARAQNLDTSRLEMADNLIALWESYQETDDPASSRPDVAS